MSALIGNPLLLTTAPSADGDAYQIEKSLRFNDPDSSYIKKKNGITGDRRTWTASFWMKNCYNAPGHIFGAWIDTNNRDNTYFIPTSGKCQFTLNWKTGGSWHVDKSSNEQLRDPSGWTHCVVHWNTTHAETTERAKVWANGRELTWGGGYGVTNPSRYALSIWNAACDHWIGAGPENDGSLQGTYMDGYIADFQFIDGLALYPAAFGSFDSTGNWNPKAFALPNPNSGTTWSTNCTFTNTDRPAANLFDGLTANSAAGVIQDNSSNTAKVTFNTTVKGSIIEVWNDSSSNVIGFNTDTPDQSVSGAAWHTIYSGPETTLSKITWKHGSSQGRLDAIRVDGVILRDSQTDPTTRNNPNDGRVFSDGITGGAWSGYPVTHAFNGALNNGHIPPSGGTSTITFSPAITVDKKVEFYIQFDGSYGDIKVNGTAIQSQLEYNSWCPITGITWPLSTIEYSAPSGSDYVTMRAIRVDGHVLLDSSVDNSFHLKFNDTSTNARLGRNSFNKGIEDSSVNGALPIYNTTAGSDGYNDGSVKGSGYREDNKPGGSGGNAAGTTDGAGLILAIPGDVLTDEHDHINTGSSAKTATSTNGSIAVSTDQSRLYGSSIFFDGSDDYIVYSSDSDFDFGTGDFTIEAWVYPNEADGADKAIFSNDWGNTGSYLITYDHSTNKGFDFFDPTSGGQLLCSTQGIYEPNHWYHLAVVRSSSTTKIYVNGREDASASHNTDLGLSTFVIGSVYDNSATECFHGYLNDIRVYKGTAKYTTNFKPPTRNDFTVNNLTTAAPALTGSSSGTASGGKSMIVKAAGGATVTGTFNAAGNSTGNINYYKSDNGINWTYIEQDTGESPSYTAKWLSMGGGSAAKQFTSTSGSYQYSLEGSTSLDSNASSQTIDQTGLTFTGALNHGEIDSFVDSPTSYGDEDTGVGGEVRGNYCTLNALGGAMNGGGLTLSQGNLHVSRSGGSNRFLDTTWSLSSGKWYYEATVGSTLSNYPRIGIWNRGGTENRSNYPGQTAAGYNRGWGANDTTYSGSGDQDDGLPIFEVNDTLMFALDMDNGKIWFGKNGTWYTNDKTTTTTASAIANNTATAKFTDLLTESTGTSWTPICHMNDGDSWTWNFGQRAFKYTAPAGFKCLCTKNLDDVFSGAELNNPSKYFDILTYTGTGTTSQDVLGLGFQPDLVWIKKRSAVGTHNVFDAVRGNTKRIFTDLDQAENTNANIFDFKATGIEVTEDSGVTADTNDENETFVAWLWDAGTSFSNSSGTNGASVASEGSYNATAGFAIVKYTGGGYAADTGVYHPLAAVPNLIIHKRTDGTSNWEVYTTEVDGSYDQLTLDTNGTKADSAQTAPTNTLFNSTWSSGQESITYLWTAIPGYSAFGSFTGNGNADGPFIYTGFQPRWIMTKNTETARQWVIWDTKRSPSNFADECLFPDVNNAEATKGPDSGTDNDIDILSNGFKIRNVDSAQNESSKKIIYAAFAEHPFKTARAR